MTNQLPSKTYEGYIGLYQSIPHFNHQIYKWQGQVKIEDMEFWTKHYQKDNRIVLVTTNYYGDRIDSDFNIYTN